jgi:2,3-dihydroxybenzoate decarboxylase
VRKIALEEHFVTPELAKYGAGTSTVTQPQLWAEASLRLLDFTQERQPEMDRCCSNRRTCC